jgi:pyrroline-5-carboxylate reductase
MKKLGFIGWSHGRSPFKGADYVRTIQKDQIIVSDIDPKRLQLISSGYGVNITANNKEILKQADMIILAVKPDVIEAC